MKIVEIKSLVIPEIKVIKCYRFQDNRGFFTEKFRQYDIEKVIPGFTLKQINESHSRAGVLRGLHIQWNPFQGKLIRTIKGHMADIAIDLRKKSPTFGKIIAYDMPTSDNEDFFEFIWIPVGFAHGNIYFEDSTIEYFCTGEYSPGNEAGINPLSPDTDWTLFDHALKEKVDKVIKNGVIISDKDKNGLTVEQWSKDPRSENFL